MTKYRIEHDRPDCIGCAACAMLAPQFWQMNEEDGKSDVKNAKKDIRGWEIVDIDENEFEQNKEAADACPVNVIHLIEKDSNKKII